MNTDLTLVCLIASERMAECEAIDRIRESEGPEAAHWFACGIGYKEGLEREFQRRVREVQGK